MLAKLLAPILQPFLDKLLALAKTEIEQLRADAKAELEETRDKAIQALADEVPKAGAAVAKAAVETVFEHTHVDEAANSVSDAISDIFDRLGLH